MNKQRIIEEYREDFIRMLEGLDIKAIYELADLLLKARDRGSFIYTLGNGGSAATASHWACDFNKGLSFGYPKRFKMICLNDNISTLTAYANDEDYGVAFLEMAKNFLHPQDILIGISGSGNSKNLMRTFEYAREKGVITVAVTGYPEAALKSLADHVVSAEIKDMQIAEDFHIMVDHILYKVISQREEVRK